jgi:hypothetical protein
MCYLTGRPSPKPQYHDPALREQLAKDRRRGSEWRRKLADYLALNYYAGQRCRIGD